MQQEKREKEMSEQCIAEDSINQQSAATLSITPDRPDLMTTAEQINTIVGLNGRIKHQPKKRRIKVSRSKHSHVSFFLRAGAVG